MTWCEFSCSVLEVNEGFQAWKGREKKAGQSLFWLLAINQGLIVIVMGEYFQ